MVENAGIKWSIHFSFKDADHTPSSKVDATPHMHFHTMLGRTAHYNRCQLFLGQ